MTKVQTAEELERGYNKPDPWGYKTCPADIDRKKRILEACNTPTLHGGEGYDRALDIACGEGWITQDLPAYEIVGYELSKQASARFPENVLSCEPFGKFDLVICTGALYAHYDWKCFVELIETHASGVIVTCSIKELEHKPAIERIQRIARSESCTTFTYLRPESDYTQILRVFRL